MTGEELADSEQKDHFYKRDFIRDTQHLCVFSFVAFSNGMPLLYWHEGARGGEKQWDHKHNWNGFFFKKNYSELSSEPQIPLEKNECRGILKASSLRKLCKTY